MVRVGAKWLARRQEIADLILHDGWLMTDVAEFFGVTLEYARCMVRQFDIPYSATKVVRLWCPWQPAVRPCVDCGRPTYPHKRRRGQCQACFGKRRWANMTPEQREAHKQQMHRWVAANPKNKRDINWRSNKAYRERHRAAGLCVHCSEPAVPGQTRCQRHREQGIARYHARKASAAA